MGVILASLVLAAFQQTQDVTIAPMSPLEEADSHFAKRAANASDDVADPKEIDAAIELYRKAVESAPDDMEILGRLLRALHFRSAYTAIEIEEKKKLLEEGQRLGQDAVDRIEKQIKSRKDARRIEALKQIRGVPALYLWTAVHWGELGLARGKLSSVKNGIAGKVRDLAQTLVEVDPAFEDAAGYRVLGRLNTQAPKVPLITGWVSHDKGIDFLRRALDISPTYLVNSYFLADALIEYRPEKRDEAKTLLERCVNASPRADLFVEETHYARLARKRLEELKTAY